MRNVKKSPEERAATRRAQNARATARKKAQGLVRVSVWVPEEALEQVADLDRVGIVCVAPEARDKSRCILIRDPDGSFRPVVYQGRLPTA